MKPSDKQVGGNHYKDFAMQPAQFIHMNKIGFLEGNVIKYVCRHAAKNGRDDLLKARHYIDLLLEWQYDGQADGTFPAPTPVDRLVDDTGDYLPAEFPGFLPDHSLKPMATCKCGRLICKVCKWPS